MTTSEGGSSFVYLLQLSTALKDFREQADLTQEQAVTELRRLGGRWSESKLSRVENHGHGVRPREVEQLLDLYRVTDETAREATLALAARARQKDPRAPYGVVLPSKTRTLVSVEAGALTIQQFETMVIPGLLQTTDYTRAIINVASPADQTQIGIERRVAARMTRQHILRRPDPPRFHVILDEAILLRKVGHPSVMRDQLRKLVDLAAEPHLTLQILPLDTGGGPGLSGPFALFTLPEPAPDLAFSEGPVTGMVFEEGREAVRGCTLKFGMLMQLALPRAESTDRIAQAARSYE